MSRKGNGLDNAVMEKFLSILKNELLYIQDFDSVEHFIQKLHEYICWSSCRRTKIKLNGMSQVEYQTYSRLIS